MEWLRALITQHTGEDGKLNVESLIKDVNKTAPEHVIPKEQYNTVAQERNQLKTTIKERDTQLEELKKAGSVDDLKKQIEDLKESNKKKEDEYQQQINDMIIDGAIEKALEKASHPELLKLKIDRTALKVEGEGTDKKVTGLEGVVSNLKKDYKDFFPIEKKGRGNPTEGKPADPSDKKPEEMTYEEFVASLENADE